MRDGLYKNERKKEREREERMYMQKRDREERLLT